MCERKSLSLKRLRITNHIFATANAYTIRSKYVRLSYYVIFILSLPPIVNLAVNHHGHVG